MKKQPAIVEQLTLNRKYDLCELIQSRYKEDCKAFDIPIRDDINVITVTNIRDGGTSITLQRGPKLLHKPLMTFRGKTLYLWDCFPIPAQTVFESSKRMSTRYRDISVEFN